MNVGLGGNGFLRAICERQRVDEVVISSARLPTERIGEIVRDCRAASAAIKRTQIQVEPLEGNTTQDLQTLRQTPMSFITQAQTDNPEGVLEASPDAETGECPLVSVIVPSYNYGNFISQALDSVLKQSYRNWECIVVDDGSTDCTREVVLRYCSHDRRFRYLRQDNSGLSAARNTGIANSSGAYLQFLDSDDLIEPRKLECQVDYLERNPEIGIVYDHVWYFDSNNPCGARRRERTVPSDGNDRYPPVVQGSWNEALLPLLENCHLMPLAPLIRRSVIESVGYFDSNMTPSEDWDYWLRCAAKGVRYQHCEFADARGCVSYHPGSMSTNHLRMAHAKVQVRKKIATLTEDRAILALNRMHWSYDMGRYGVELITQGHVLLGELRLMQSAIMSCNVKHIFRWSACALLALFVRGSRFRAIALSPWNRAIAALLGR